MNEIEKTHPRYDDLIHRWKKIDDITRRRNTTNYLLIPNEHDTSPENLLRIRKYKERAVFYGLSGQTVRGFVATMFRKFPQLEVPPQLEYVKDNVDGAGVSIYQQSQKTAVDVIKKSRAGLYVSFPRSDRPISRADVTSGLYVPIINHLAPSQIVDWDVTSVGSRSIISRVVFINKQDKQEQEELRELVLRDGAFLDVLWVKDKNGWRVEKEFVITKSDGTPWREIPFMFVGSENNDHNPDDPLMEGIVDLDIAHYRNSAEYEHSAWFTGQAQAWASGLRVDDMTELRENGFYFGGPFLFPLPPGGQLGIAQALPNSMAKEAMADKIEMMIGLGARMIQPGTVAKTATQSESDETIQHSQLSLISSNVGEAYTQCIKWMGDFIGANTEAAIYQPSMDFVDNRVDPQVLREMMQGFLQGVVPVGEYHNYLQKVDLADKEKTLEEFEAELGGNRSLPLDE